MLAVGVLGSTALIGPDGVATGIAARRHGEVLAVLAAHHSRRVSAEVIADLIWRGDPPASSAVTLQSYVSRIRRLLLPYSDGGPPPLVTEGSGYRLAVPSDVDHFEAALGEARNLLADEPLSAADLLAEALGWWRGPAYADVRDVAELAPEIERVEELHVVAQELHGQALLDAGRDAEVVPGLRELVLEHPLRERTHALLATALFRSGRQADALALLRTLRSRLVDELGVDPGSEITDLEQRLLQQDPSLEAPRRPAALTTPALVGRAAEMEALTTAWHRAQSGRVVTAVVRGEAGIGKTALVEAFVASVAAPDGAEVRWGRCLTAAGAPALWPWLRVMDGVLELEGDVESGRFALCLDLARRLSGLAARAGCVVVLDDVHWADADSLVVLETCLHALASAPVLLVLTARDELPRAPEELSRVLDAMSRRDGHVDLGLRGLDADDAEALAPGLADEELRDLLARTGGNPFFLKSLLGVGPTPAPPPTVRDMVRQRLGSLPEGGPDLVAVLSVAACEVALPALAAASGRSLEELEAPLATALRAGLVSEPLPGRFAIAHEILREAVEADLTPVVRLRLHHALADAFDAQGPGSEAIVAEHLLAATSGHRDDRAAAAALSAGRAALQAAALDEALSLAHRGIAAAADPVLTEQLHRVAGVAARRLGRHEDGEAEFAAAASLARTRGSWESLAETALESFPGSVGGYWAFFALPLLGQPVLLEEALQHLDSLPGTLRARLLAASATQRAAVGKSGAATLADRALEEAGGDPDARARALIASIVASWTPDLAERQLAAVEQLLTVSRGDPALEATAHHLHRCVLLVLGRTAEAARAARAFAAVARRQGDPDLLLLDTWWQIGQLITAGDRERARRLAAEEERSSATISPAGAMIGQLSRATVDGITAWLDGDLMKALPEAEDLAAEVDPDFVLVVALANAEAGHREPALRAVDSVLRLPAEGSRAVPRTIMLSEALVALRDAERLARLVPVLRSWSGRIVVQWPGDVCMGPVDLYLGAALGVTGSTDEAREVLERALAQCEQIGAAPYAERARRRLRELDHSS